MLSMKLTKLVQRKLISKTKEGKMHVAEKQGAMLWL